MPRSHASARQLSVKITGNKMSENSKSASKWLSKKMAAARSTYMIASLFTLFSASCFVVFSWYLATFAAEWLDNGLIVARRSEEHTSELQSRPHLVCRLLL